MKSDLPKRVFEKHGTYYFVKADGAKRKWTRLSRVKEGLPELYQALAKVTAADILQDTVPKLIGDWLSEVSTLHAKKTQANDAYMCREVSKSFVEFRAEQIRPPHVVEFLKSFQSMPRTYNAYRSHIRELMRFAEEKGFREPGTNPVDSLRTMTVKARTRYITDSELRRIKVGAVYSKPHPKTGHKTRNRSGLMICGLIDMAYLTGQRIGDLLTLEWSQLGKDGILFEPAKVEGSTGAKVLIEWSPKLRNVVARLKAFQRPHYRFVFSKLSGQPYKYAGTRSAWNRAVERAGVALCHFHDIRAKSLTDVDDKRGMGEAQKMGGHSTPNQTADYVRHKTARKTGATR